MANGTGAAAGGVAGLRETVRATLGARVPPGHLEGVSVSWDAVLRAHAALLEEPLPKAARAVSFEVDDLGLVLLRGADGAALRAGLRPRIEDPLASATTSAMRAFDEAAHDFGGPLTSLIASLDQVLDEDPGASVSAAAREGLEDARRSLFKLVDGVRRRREALDVFAVPGDRDGDQDVVADVAHALRDESRRLQVEVVVHGSERLAFAVGGGVLHACVMGLALNGLEVARVRRGPLSLRVVRDLEPGWARIEVEDGGAGMDAEALARAGDVGHTTRRTGVGLGLSALRWAMRPVGGALCLDSTPGQGTRATLRLPLR
jgi:signal transduction histidine kinase